MAISPLQTVSALPTVPTTQENERERQCKPPAVERTERGAASLPANMSTTSQKYREHDQDKSRNKEKTGRVH